MSAPNAARTAAHVVHVALERQRRDPRTDGELVECDAERVRGYLENAAPDVIVGDRNAQGFWLYTTGEHLAKSTGDVMKRFYEVEETS